MSVFVKVFCKTCKRLILRLRGRVNENKKLGHNFYCSKLCEYKSKTKKRILVCGNALCERVFKRSQGYVSTHNYCSQSCAATVNNKKFPKRGPVFKVCANRTCENQVKNSRVYCSQSCLDVVKQKYTPQNVIDAIRLTARELRRVPSRREMKRVVDACIRFFGSWNKAVAVAGFQPNRSHNQRMYRRSITKAFDGHLCDSISEAIIDNWFTVNKVLHKREVAYPGTNHKADWGLKENEVFVEYFGLAKDCRRYDLTIEEKRGLCRRHNIRLVEIYPSDLYPNIRLDEKFKLGVSSFSLFPVKP